MAEKLYFIFFQNNDEFQSPGWWLVLFLIAHSLCGCTYYRRNRLTDGRKLSIPLWWIPTLHHASPEEREKYEINQSRTMIIWDPEKCEINDEIHIADYLGAPTEES